MAFPIPTPSHIEDSNGAPVLDSNFPELSANLAQAQTRRGKALFRDTFNGPKGCRLEPRGQRANELFHGAASAARCIVEDEHAPTLSHPSYIGKKKVMLG